MLGGADSIDDLDVLRHGGMNRVFTGVRAPSTLSTFLRGFTFGHVRQIDAVSSRVLAGLSSAVPRLLTGTDGERKMSKSLGNYIAVTDSPEQMYGRTLSLPDSSLASWYALLLGGPVPDGTTPREAKRALARALVTRFHETPAALAAEREFDRVHVQHRAPSEVPEVVWTLPKDGGEAPEVHLPALLAVAFGISTSEARRALGQGGVRLDGEPMNGSVLDRRWQELDGRVLQLGKRRFARIRAD